MGTEYKLYTFGSLVSYIPTGEGGGNRTLDALIKSQVLYRLSYTLKGVGFLQNPNCVLLR